MAVELIVNYENIFQKLKPYDEMSLGKVPKY